MYSFGCIRGGDSESSHEMCKFSTNFAPNLDVSSAAHGELNNNSVPIDILHDIQPIDSAGMQVYCVFNINAMNH